jgi:hypothetical protein
LFLVVVLGSFVGNHDVKEWHEKRMAVRMKSFENKGIVYWMSTTLNTSIASFTRAKGFARTFGNYFAEPFEDEQNVDIQWTSAFCMIRWFWMALIR